ncbi:MAG: N-acetylmuramoyl-L-alanine amidase [Bacteroidota bacterium]|nr:N-acetylmuramoyl-L-alanine amidase [Bacteroidota bacterium]
MKYYRILILLSIIFVFSSFQTLNDSKFHVKTIVIDAGHGGKDPGAISAGIKEKDVALSIAKKLGDIIEENLDDVKVIYTRKTDVFIGLYERARIANNQSANVFISIHCNAVRSTNAYGTETFVMGVHKNEKNLSVAMKENSVIKMEENYLDKYDGFDPSSPEAHIIFSLVQNAYTEQSLNLASKIEDQFKNRVHRKSRGVKQAGFLVLWETTMPSVLIETGFLSNANERKYLTSDIGQVYIASAIFRAFRNFKTELEENN